MGQKVHPLIFRSLQYKHYRHNFYIHIKKNNIDNNLNLFYLLYVLYYMYKQYSLYNIKIEFQFFINKLYIQLIQCKDKINYYNSKIIIYFFILLNYINYYYYNKYKLLCYLQIKYYTKLNVYIISLLIKILYLKYKSFKFVITLLYTYLFNICNYIIKGLKIKISGRFKNSLKKKTEIYIYGILSLHNISQNITYDNIILFTKYGILGLKIWLYI